MTQKPFEELLEGYINSSLKKDELDRFLQLLESGEHAEEIKNATGQLLQEQPSVSLKENGRGESIFQNIMEHAAGMQTEEEPEIGSLNSRSGTFSLFKMAAAACVIGTILFGGYYLFNEEPQKILSKSEVKQINYKNDLPPGGDKALLTLADGSVIFLDDAKNGPLTQQGNTKVIKLDGKINYISTDAAANEIVYNSISTPRGGQYQIILPDGSGVWLNSTSSIRFPTTFAGKSRTVEITGEAYFEVAKNKEMPFIVKVNKAEIQVLGTHFNVMAYSDESLLKTTLLEGSVQFIKDNKTSILTPGQQAQLSGDGRVKVVSDIDVKKVIAWKNGVFNFEGADIATVLRQISRWYDVEVVYNKKVDDLFYAEIPRNTRLSDFLKALELTGTVHFEIDGKKIIVMP